MEKDPINYFRLLYGSLRFPIQVIAETGKVIYVNEAFSIQWGYDLSELEEYNVFNDSQLKNSGAAQKIKETFSNDKYHAFPNFSDSLLKSHQEAIPFLRTNIFKVNFGKESYVVLLHEDQTENILSEEEIKKARDASKEADRLKNNFLNVLSHELRTPLNIILGYSSLIKENLKDKIGAEDRVYLDNLYSGSERLFKSITQMLEFAQLEAGNYALNIETIDLINLVENCIVPFKKQANEKNLKLKTNFSENKVYVDVDAHCVESAFINLLNNAVKFTNHGFIEVEIELLQERELALCKIRDTGVGISSEYLDHLYQPFSQEDLKVGRNYEGNGLGLALAKRYIEKAGGSLLVDSIKGVGSTFTFTIPLTENPMFKLTTGSASDQLDENHILMLDDTGETSELITAFLKNSFRIINYDFRTFKIETIKNNNFSFIILDVNKNYWQQGIVICKDIKRYDPFKRPVIIISSEYLENRIKEFYDAGASRFLVKPFSKSQLLEAVSFNKN